MILEFLPENILESLCWYPWAHMSGDNMVLLFKKQKRMRRLEGISWDRNVLQEIQKIPDFDKAFENVVDLGLFPDSQEVLDFCHLLVKKSPKVHKLTLQAGFQLLSEEVPPPPNLMDSSTGPGLITSTIFSHLQPFEKCTPLALREVTLQRVSLRYASLTYCKFIDFRSVRSININSCPGADALFAELSKSTTLPEKLEALKFYHVEDREQEGLGAVDGFLRLVQGIKLLTLDIMDARRMPAAAGIVRHAKTLKSLIVHANPAPPLDELVYDYPSFETICKNCSELEQISVAFPSVGMLSQEQDTFMDFGNCLGHLPNLVTLNITSWPHSTPPLSPHMPPIPFFRIPYKTYKHLLQLLAQQAFEASVEHAKEHSRTSKLAIIAWGSSDKIHERQESDKQIIFTKGKQIDPLGTEKPTAIEISWSLRKFLDAGPKSTILNCTLQRSTKPPCFKAPGSEDPDLGPDFQ